MTPTPSTYTKKKGKSLKINHRFAFFDPSKMGSSTNSWAPRASRLLWAWPPWCIWWPRAKPPGAPTKRALPWHGTAFSEVNSDHRISHQSMVYYIHILYVYIYIFDITLLYIININNDANLERLMINVDTFRWVHKVISLKRGANDRPWQLYDMICWKSGWFIKIRLKLQMKLTYLSWHLIDLWIIVLWAKLMKAKLTGIPHAQPEIPWCCAYKMQWARSQF